MSDSTFKELDLDNLGSVDLNIEPTTDDIEIVDRSVSGAGVSGWGN